MTDDNLDPVQRLARLAIRDLLREGKTPREIALMLGVPEERVHEMIEKWGVEPWKP